jgi:hypothetical protein
VEKETKDQVSLQKWVAIFFGQPNPHCFTVDLSTGLARAMGKLLACKMVNNNL